MSHIEKFKGSRNAPSSAAIILDESGDLGFSPQHSSRHFVVAATIVPEPNDIARLAKRARNKSRKRGWGEELKFNNSEDSTKMLVLKSVAQMDCQILWVSFDKQNIPARLRENKKLLYQLACEAVLQEAVKRTPSKNVHIIIDKRYRKIRDRDSLEHHIMAMLKESHVGFFSPKFRISQYDSFMSSELQVHDFIVGAVYQLVERDIGAYIGLIGSKIIFGERR